MPVMAGVLAPATTSRGVLPFTTRERDLLLRLQRQALQYFLDNQAADGLMLDRQRNRGRRRTTGLCSTAATGMGLIALALASASPHRLIDRNEAIARVRAALEGALRRPDGDRGILPHFVDARSGLAIGIDALSTVDSAWLLAGALWAAAFLRDTELETLAGRLYARVDWAYWSVESEAGPLLRHGKGHDGQFLTGTWDRLNGETIFMYVLAAGAEAGRALPASAWEALGLCYGTVAGHRFNNADLGLFVFQYGLDLLDLRAWQAPGGVDLPSEAAEATAANVDACREAADDFATYQRYWGLSAGDGPGDAPARDGYRAYTPVGPIDGTAHLTASLASIAHRPCEVLANVLAAHREPELSPLGRYGLSNVNLDRGWIGRDMIGIDAGAAALALENVLADDRVRTYFHALPCVQTGLARLGFTQRCQSRQAS